MIYSRSYRKYFSTWARFILEGCWWEHFAGNQYSKWVTQTWRKIIQHCCVLTYHIFSYKCPQRLFSFETLRCETHWRAALNRGRNLFQCKINHSHEISKLRNFFFPNTVFKIGQISWRQKLLSISQYSMAITT